MNEEVPCDYKLYAHSDKIHLLYFNIMHIEAIISYFVVTARTFIGKRHLYICPMHCNDGYYVQCIIGTSIATINTMTTIDDGTCAPGDINVQSISGVDGRQIQSI